ncbi:carboxypeptidase B-like [Vanessa tameamea]|uniref:Carboxypeptidase B-like n=1 Tax=Vanessa tameamea TaxID=334116 RepID=A0A8B8IHB9_VANTA|nr:carboxypeptidase B-like [Vanessa tameamea]
MDVMVDANRKMQVEKLLRDRDIEFEVTGTDGSRNKSPTTGYLSPRPKSPKRTLDWKDFYPLNVIYNFMDNLEIQYPSSCSVTSIGQSVEGRDIKMLKISNSNAGNSGVWIDGGIHSREWITVSVVTYIADQFARNLDNLPENITNKDWYFLPVVNPDGYHYSHTNERMWRKNRARVGNSIFGVDLNRNFGYYWGRGGVDSSSEDPSHLNFRGSEPFSEPETAAIKDFILYSSTRFKIFLTFHAYSEVISFPWCFTADPCADYVNLLEGGTTMSKAIYNVNGRMYKVGNFKDLMYFATGTSIDWSYGSARIPFSYLIELRSRQHKFLLPKEEILDCCKEIIQGVKALAEFVDKKKCLNCSLFYNKNC